VRTGRAVFLICLAGTLSQQGCASTMARSNPPFPIFSGGTAGISAVVAEVDSLIEGAPHSPLLLVSARVLTVIHGEQRSRITFPTSIGLCGCGSAWAVSGFGGGYSDPGAESTRWWFSLGDTIVSIVREDPWGNAWQQADFVRWVRASPGGDGQVVMKEGKVDFFSVAALGERCRTASVGERYAAVSRNWVPDGRTLCRLTEEIADFYGNRRKEYWTRWGYPDPWRPNGPLQPPPAPGE
jgi:hypothetical protein